MCTTTSGCPPPLWSRGPQEASTLSSWLTCLTGGRVWEGSSSLWKPQGQRSCDTALPQVTWRRPAVKIEVLHLWRLLTSVLKHFVVAASAALFLVAISLSLKCLGVKPQSGLPMPDKCVLLSCTLISQFCFVNWDNGHLTQLWENSHAHLSALK